jgi:hypothetical protein
MPRPEQYRRIAERYISAGRLSADQVPEAAGFAAYHAFESIGCAGIRHRNQKVPMRHDVKVNKFVQLGRREGFRHGAAQLAILTTAIRNKMLYPVPNGSGAYDLPETMLSSANATDLLRRVDGLARTVSRSL